jgi:hypothetical protein
MNEVKHMFRSLSPKADISYCAANVCFYPERTLAASIWCDAQIYISIMLCEERLSGWIDRMSGATLTRD